MSEIVKLPPLLYILIFENSSVFIIWHICIIHQLPILDVQQRIVLRFFTFIMIKILFLFFFCSLRNQVKQFYRLLIPTELLRECFHHILILFLWIRHHHICTYNKEHQILFLKEIHSGWSTQLQKQYNVIQKWNGHMYNLNDLSIWKGHFIYFSKVSAKFVAWMNTSLGPSRPLTAVLRSLKRRVCQITIPGRLSNLHSLEEPVQDDDHLWDKEESDRWRGSNTRLSVSERCSPSKPLPKNCFSEKLERHVLS